jgi:hypothetical protein
MDHGVWLSLSVLNEEVPDHHHGSTVDNLDEIYDVSEDLECWHEEDVKVDQIDPCQLIDDPDDGEGHTKVESIRTTLRVEGWLPAVILIHHPDEKDFPYTLIEGRHRYNATHREGRSHIFAWVAHVACCGGPPPDL